MEENEPEPVEKEERPPLGGLALLMILPLIGGIVGYFGSALVTYVQPKIYESVMMLQVLPTAREIDPFDGTGSVGSGVTPRFIATEARVITADATLERVGERLNLSERWTQSPENVLAILRKVVVAEHLEGTDLVEVRVRHSNANDARDIAEAVATAYRERRREMELERARRVLNALDSEMRNQEDLVAAKRKVLDTVAQALGIPFQEGVAGDRRSASTEAELRSAEHAVSNLETELLQGEIEISMLLKLETDALLTQVLSSDAAPDGLRELRRAHRIESNVLAALVKDGMVDWSEEVVRQRATVEVLAKEIQETMVGLRQGLTMKLNLMEGRLKAMREDLHRRRTTAVDAALEAHDFLEAKREFERAQGLLQSMALQSSLQRVALKIPSEPITIHATPRRGSTPVSPDVEGNMAMGVVLGAAVGLILAIVIGVLQRMTGRGVPADDEWA